MCGRFTRKYTYRELHGAASRAGVRLVMSDEVYTIRPSFNVAPTLFSSVIALTSDGYVVRDMQFGLIPSWSKDGKPVVGSINARSETAADKPMFRTAMQKRRAIVPVSGFFEWQKLDDGGKTKKQPWYIHRADGQIVMLAGLWEYWKPQTAGDGILSFSILTTGPNALMATLHDRMPVVLEPEHAKTWIDDGNLDLLKPAADGVLTAYRVSTMVNSPKNDTSACIEPLGETPPPSASTLWSA